MFTLDDDTSRRAVYDNGLGHSLALSNSVANQPASLEDQVASAFEKWRVSIYRYLCIAGGNPSEAEEITQECFVRLFRELHAAKPVENPQRWLFRVAHNLLIDHTRRTQPYSASSPDVAHIVEDRHDPRPNPEQRLLGEERMAQMQQALNALTSLQRNCLQLRTEGFRHREIAEILGISMDSVADALRRGLSRLSRHSHE